MTSKVRHKVVMKADAKASAFFRYEGHVVYESCKTKGVGKNFVMH